MTTPTLSTRETAAPPVGLYRVGAWAPLAYLLVFGTGWLVLGHFFPPFSPADGPDEIAHQFLDRRIQILTGSVLMMVSTVILMPYAALLTLIVRKAEGGAGMLTLMMGFTQVTYMVMNFFVPFAFAMATFRPDRDPGLIQFAGDFGFMQFIGGIAMFWMIWAVTAWAALVTPSRGTAVIPRWFGYLNLWCAILYLPELLIFFFHTGPFAWDGLVGFWIPAAVFIIYLLAATPVFLRIVGRHFHDA
ncbi:hypothetical protein [Nocardia amamiensis]|uniref:hypothetical protein n=1 Tax=Nocardia TaxID=1817 RepID=UPI0033D8F212